MKLTFENSFGEEREIAVVSSEKEAFVKIQEFLDAHNFKSYYTRTTFFGTAKRMYDVGSHTEFFYLYAEEGEEF